MSKLKLIPALTLAVLVGLAAVASTEAVARTTQCWKCVGGYCCY